MVGEHPDSRLRWIARARGDVRRADSVPPFPGRIRTRHHRPLSLPRLPYPRRDRALRAMRRAVGRRDRRLRLAADPNIITWPGTIAGFIAASLMMPEVGWKSSLLGIAVGGGVLYGTGYFYQLVRGREG